MDTTLKSIVEQLYGISVLDEGILYGKGSGIVTLLHTPNGKKVLKQHSHLLTQDRLATQHSLTQQLRSDGMLVIPAVYPITARHVDEVVLSSNHPTFFTYQGKNFSLQEFKDGTPYSWNNGQLSDVARVLASFHKHLKPHAEKDYSCNSRFERVLGELGNLERQISEAESYAALDPALISGLKNLIPAIEAYKGVIEGINSSPDYKQLLDNYTIIHGDFHQKNVLFLDEKVNAILDLDSVRTDRRVYEVAFALFEFTSLYTQDGDSWRFDRLDPQKASLFINEYQQHNPLNGPLIDGMYIMLMERFLTRLSYGLEQVKGGNTNENSVIKEMLNCLSRLPNSFGELYLGTGGK